MKLGTKLGAAIVGSGIVIAAIVASAQPTENEMPVPFATTMAKMTADKPKIEQAHRALLAQRYDLSNRPAAGVSMTRGKPVQEGVRVTLPNGMTWDKLAALTPHDIRARDLFPAGFLPLPHPNHPVGGMVFPQPTIDEIKRQTNRDLTRFDLDFDFPDHVMPEFPPAIFLTTRTDLGDVSGGKVITLENFHAQFDHIMNPKQIEGFRLLLTPFPQQQFNATTDRNSVHPSEGVACFDCHVNGHTNGATHQVGDIRPQEFRHRIDTTSLRGVNIQRLFGSQRALKTVEDFTQFEQRAAYFDGDIIRATKKGVNPLERGSQVHFMSEVQEILDFPPAPKLRVSDGRLDPILATADEKRGEALFYGKAQCANCHPAPFFTDNSMHDLKTERFYTPRTVGGMRMVGDGPIKTFTLRGIKESPPYFHDGRLITLEDTIEFFNLVLGTQLTAGEKQDLLAFLRVL
jgi:cytochrome c peroxidase